MKAFSVAAAAAGLAGSAVATDSWNNWSSVTTPSTTAPVTTTTTPASTSSPWTSPVTSSVTTSSGTWTSTVSTSSVSTSSGTWTSPATSSSTWNVWTSSSSATTSSGTWTSSSSSTTTSATTSSGIWTSPATSAPTTWATWTSAPESWSTVGVTETSITGTVTETSTIISTLYVSATATATSTSPVISPFQSGQCVITVSTWYGQATWVPSPASSPATTTSASSSPAWTAPATTTSGVWTSSSSSVPSSSAWSAWSSAPSSGSSSSSSPSIGGSGNTWAMTWSPYTASSGCKAQSVVAAEVAHMASLGFSAMRVYSTACNTLEYVGEACRANNMKMIIGVFISNTGVAGAQSQVTDITKWGQWDLVEVAVIGNEAIFNGYTTASELVGFIASCRSAFKAAGYNGPVTTTEDLSVWQSNAATLCGAVDVAAANLYAFFNPQTTADQAGTFIQAEIAELEKLCPGKNSYVMECGWPSAGDCNGLACPSPENQKTALKAIQQAVGSKIVFFSYENELWKSPGPLNVERNWGCADIF